MDNQQRRISIRLGLEDYEKVKLALEKLGEDGQKTIKKIETASAAATPAMKAFNATLAEGGDAVRNMASSAGPLGSVLSALGVGGQVAAAAIAAIAVVQGPAIRAFAEAEKVALRFDAILKATGNTTGFTRIELDKMAESLSRVTAIDDDAFKGAAATLSTFGSVSGEVFKGVLEQAANLSATFGGDLQSNTEKLGDVMDNLANGSVEGITKAFKALSPEQEKHLKLLAESGHGYEAQIELLGIMQSKIGGTSAAEANGLIGSARALANAWEDLQKSIAISEPVRNAIQNLTELLRLVNSALNKTDEQRLSEVGSKIADKETKLAKLAPKITGNFVNSTDVAAYNDTKKELDDLNKLAQAINIKIEAERDGQRLQQEIASDKRKMHDEAKQEEIRETARAEAAKKRLAERASLADKAAKEQQRLSEEAVRAYEKHQHAIDEMVKHATERVVDFGADAFDKVLKDGKSAFAEIGDSALSIMRKTFAQIASEAVIRPLIQPILSNIIGGSGIAGNNSSGSSGGIGDLLGGNLPNINLFGSGTSSFINDIGTNLGFSAEAARPFESFIGPMPNAGGSLFSSTLSQTLGNSSYGFIGSTAAQLFGLSSGGVGSSIGGTIGSIGGSAVGGPIGSIVGSFLGSTLGGLFDGDSEGYKKAVEARKRTLEQDAFVTNTLNPFLASTAKTTAAGRAMAELNTKMQQMSAEAQRLGLGVEGITKTFDLLKKKITDDFNDSINSAIAQYENDPTYALKALRKTQSDRIDEAIDAEGDLAAVRKLNALELEDFYKKLSVDQLNVLGDLGNAVDMLRAKVASIGTQLTSSIKDQLDLVNQQASLSKSAQEFYANAVKTLEKQIIDLRGSDLTTLSPYEVLQQNRAQFEDVFARAQLGNQDAISSLPQVAQTFLQSSMKYNSATEAYASDFNRVLNALSATGKASGVLSTSEGNRGEVLDAQKRLLQAINDNLASAKPNTGLLKDQQDALVALNKAVRDGTTIQDVIKDLTSYNAAISEEVLKNIQGSAGQLSLVDAITTGDDKIAGLLGEYINYTRERDGAAAAAAAKQAQVDAHLAKAITDGKNIEKALAAVPKSGGSENQHSWGVVFDALSNSVLNSFGLDRGSAEYDKPRADLAARTISEAMNVVLKSVGITGVPTAFADIATKYGSSLSVGNAQFTTSINDYQGLTSFGITQALAQGTGGNPALRDYAASLNWYDYAGSLKALEQKAIDLGLRGFAAGTSSAPSGWAWVGENGPELMNMRGGERVVPANQSSAMFQGDVVRAIQMHNSSVISQFSGLKDSFDDLRREFYLMRIEKRAV